MVQAQDGGEDSAGRSKLTLMPIKDVVTRAIGMTKLTFRELESKGWIQQVPPWEEIQSLGESMEPENPSHGESYQRLKAGKIRFKDLL